MDDVSVAILKGLSALPDSSQLSMQRMRWTVECTVDGNTLSRQPFPYFSIRYIELQKLLAAVTQDTATYGVGVISVEVAPAGAVQRVHFTDGTTAEYDMVPP